MHTRRLINTLLLLLLFLLPATPVVAGNTDSINSKSSTAWIRQLIDNGFHIHDTTIHYPRFPRFALRVYNWGDRTFNSYDTTYVVGTGKNWKLMGKSYNWLETSTMLFPEDVKLEMHSNLFSDAGFRLSFMAVSIGYMWNMNKLFSHPASRQTFDFAFNTSRFSITYQTVSSEGGMIITRLGDYNHGKTIRKRFDDVSIKSTSARAIYFFNHNRYSHAAAYAYSKYQLISAGTALLGIGFTEQRMGMNFASLPEDMQSYVPLQSLVYSSHYRSYNVIGGYSYNWVLKPRRWLVNFFGTAGIGYRQIFGTSESRDVRELLAQQFLLSTAAVYNHRKLFLAFNIQFQGFFNYNSSHSHFSSFPSFSAAVGMRF